MRRRTGSIQQLGPNKYRVRISNGRHPITGTRDQPSRTVYGTYADAETELAALRAEIDATGDIPRTFNELWDEWDTTTIAQGRCKTTTSYTDRLIYERRIKPTLGQMRPADIQLTPGEGSISAKGDMTELESTAHAVIPKSRMNSAGS